MHGMGNRSRRRRHADGTIEAVYRPEPDRSVGSMNDPLYGIPDTNMPYLASIRMARALQGHGGWRKAYAIYALLSTLLGAIGFWLFVVIRWLLTTY